MSKVTLQALLLSGLLLLQGCVSFGLAVDVDLSKMPDWLKTTTTIEDSPTTPLVRSSDAE